MEIEVNLEILALPKIGATYLVFCELQRMTIAQKNNVHRFANAPSVKKKV